MQGQVDATVTNAISKEAINLAGHYYSGHTEIYAHGTGFGHAGNGHANPLSLQNAMDYAIALANDRNKP